MVGTFGTYSEAAVSEWECSGVNYVRSCMKISQLVTNPYQILYLETQTYLKAIYICKAVFSIIIWPL